MSNAFFRSIKTAPVYMFWSVCSLIWSIKYVTTCCVDLERRKPNWVELILSRWVVICWCTTFSMIFEKNWHFYFCIIQFYPTMKSYNYVYSYLVFGSNKYKDRSSKFLSQNSICVQWIHAYYWNYSNALTQKENIIEKSHDNPRFCRITMTKKNPMTIPVFSGIPDCWEPCIYIRLLLWKFFQT